MLWTVQTISPHNTSLSPHDNSKNKHERGGPRDKVTGAHRCIALRPKLQRLKVVQLGHEPGLSAVEACALSVSPLSSWLSLNGWCLTPRP